MIVTQRTLIMKRPEQKPILLVAILVLLVGTMAIWLLGRGTADQSLEGTTIRALGHIRIREAPSLSATRLSYIPWGENAQVIGIDETGEWYQINYNGLIGWSAADWFEKAEGEAPPKVVAPTTLTTDGSLQVRALDSIRIRQQPSILADRLGAISWGDVVSVLAVDSTGEWYQVNYNGLIGWSAKDWFEVVSGDPQNAQTVEGAIYVQSRANVRLRETPHEEAPILDTIYRGGHALVLGQTTDGTWFRLRYNNLDGWATALYFMIDPNYQPPFGVNAAANVADASILDIPVIEVADKPETRPEATPSVDEESVPIRSDETMRLETAQQTTPPRVEEVIEIELPSIPIGTVVMQNTNDVLPIRMSPQRNSGTLGVIRQGEQAVVVEQDGMWLRVNHYGIVGWVRGDLFEVTDTLVDPESIEASLITTDDEVLPIAAGAIIETQGALVRILSNPTAESATIGTIARGAQAQIIAIDPTGAWFQINQQGVIGWVQAVWFKAIED